MTLATLLLLQRCLHAQQMSVGDPAFATTARQVLDALAELDVEIAAEISRSPEAAEAIDSLTT